MSRVKRDGNPFKSMLWLMQKYVVDYFIVAGNGSEQEKHQLPRTY
mgnify:FL=1